MKIEGDPLNTMWRRRRLSLFVIQSQMRIRPTGGGGIGG